MSGSRVTAPNLVFTLRALLAVGIACGGAGEPLRVLGGFHCRQSRPAISLERNENA